MRLREYFKLHCVNLAQFCRKNNLSYHTIRDLMQGHECYLSTAIEIENATQKNVTVYDLALEKKVFKRKLARITRIQAKEKNEDKKENHA